MGACDVASHKGIWALILVPKGACNGSKRGQDAGERVLGCLARARRVPGLSKSMVRSSIPMLHPHHSELWVPCSRVQKHQSFMPDWTKWRGSVMTIFGQARWMASAWASELGGDPLRSRTMAAFPWAAKADCTLRHPPGCSPLPLLVPTCPPRVLRPQVLCRDAGPLGRWAVVALALIPSPGCV